MPDYTLNPAYITGSMSQMPQINANNGVGINTAALPTQPYTTPLAFQSTGAMNPSSAPGLLGGIASIGTSLINNLFENYRVKQQMKYNKEASATEWERTKEMWNMTNDYNNPSAQVQRLQDAGLNPMYYGLDGSSASNMSAPQQLGYERSTMPALENPFPAMMDARVKEAQIANINAETEKTKSETDQTALENDFLERTLDIRVKSEFTKNELDEARIKEVKAHCDEILKVMEKMDAEIKTEGARQVLFATESLLKQGEYQRLMTLLPLEANLLLAKTESERAQASVFALQASIEQFKMDDGYYESMVGKMKAECNSAEAKAVVGELMSHVRTGNPNSLAQWFKDNPNWKAAMPGLAFLSGDMMKVAADLKDSGLLQLVGFAAGGRFLAGKKSVVPSAGQAGGPPKYATLYGPDGRPIMYN